jgi:ribonucleoside-diphosphate reductase beta chain
VVKDDLDFQKLQDECKDQVYAMYMEIIEEEKAWAEYLFKKGVVIGLNANILKDFVDYTAFVKLKEIGIKYLSDYPKTTPIPWFNKHVNINKKQSALQETESTNYVIGVMGEEVDKQELPEL